MVDKRAKMPGQFITVQEVEPALWVVLDVSRVEYVSPSSAKDESGEVVFMIDLVIEGEDLVTTLRFENKEVRDQLAERLDQILDERDEDELSKIVRDIEGGDA